MYNFSVISLLHCRELSHGFQTLKFLLTWIFRFYFIILTECGAISFLCAATEYLSVIFYFYFSARLGCICCDDFTFFGNSVFVMVVEQGQIWKYRQSTQKGRLNKLPLFLYMNQSMNVSRVIQSWNERKKYEKPKKKTDFVIWLYIRTRINSNTNRAPSSYLMMSKLYASPFYD